MCLVLGNHLKQRALKKEAVGAEGRVKVGRIWVKCCSPLLLHVSRNISAAVTVKEVDSELFLPRPSEARINGTFDSFPIWVEKFSKYFINVSHPLSFVCLGLSLVLSPRPPFFSPVEPRAEFFFLLQKHTIMVFSFLEGALNSSGNVTECSIFTLFQHVSQKKSQSNFIKCVQLLL